MTFEQATWVSLGRALWATGGKWTSWGNRKKVDKLKLSQSYTKEVRDCVERQREALRMVDTEGYV